MVFALFLGMGSPLLTTRSGLMTPTEGNSWWEFDGELLAFIRTHMRHSC